MLCATSRNMHVIYYRCEFWGLTNLRHSAAVLFPDKVFDFGVLRIGVYLPPLDPPFK